MTETGLADLLHMAAKAEAVSEKILSEDYDRHGKIAVSLAADVLRYFGARCVIGRGLSMASEGHRRKSWFRAPKVISRLEFR